MSNIVKLHSVREKLVGDGELRVMAQRALTPPDLPFDGLHIEPAMVLNQLDLAAKIPEATASEPEMRTTYSDDAS